MYIIYIKVNLEKNEKQKVDFKKYITNRCNKR